MHKNYNYSLKDNNWVLFLTEHFGFVPKFLLDFGFVEKSFNLNLFSKKIFYNFNNYTSFDVLKSYNLITYNLDSFFNINGYSFGLNLELMRWFCFFSFKLYSIESLFYNSKYYNFKILYDKLNISFLFKDKFIVLQDYLLLFNNNLHSNINYFYFFSRITSTKLEKSLISNKYLNRIKKNTSSSINKNKYFKIYDDILLLYKDSRLAFFKSRFIFISLFFYKQMYSLFYEYCFFLLFIFKWQFKKNKNLVYKRYKAGLKK